MTVQLAPTPVFRGVDAFGFPLYLGQLGTFVAGTNTPQVTYKDSLGIATNTNPVILNPRGECNLWLDPAKAYKLVLSDAQGNLIWTVDNVTIGNANPSYNIIPVTDNLYNLGSATFSWANVYAKTNIFVGPTLIPLINATTGIIGYYPRTAAEINATPPVIPTNFSYPELDVKRYGAVGDGVTDDSGAFTSAGLVAQVNGGEIFVSKPTVQYLLTHTVNWTNGNTVAPQHGFCVRGCAGGYDNATSAHILLKHTGYGFDCSGTNSIRFLNLTIATDAVTYPQVGFFHARNTIKNSTLYRFTNVLAIGSFSRCIRYNYGAEQDVLVGCTFYNNAADAGASIEVITANNILGLSSTFITIATGLVSCINHRYYACDFFMNSTSATADIFKLDNCLELFIDSCFCDSRGRSVIFVDPTNGTSNFVRLAKTEGENSSPLPTYSVYFGPAGATQTPSGWSIEDSYLPSVTRCIFADTNIVLDNFSLRGIAENASHGLQATTLQNSIVDCPNMVLVLGTSRQNRLTGDTSGWTITTRTNDYWEDVGTTNKSWTAVLTALTITGALTRNEQHCIAHGSLVTLTLTITAATSIVCAAGVAITGLPFPVSNRSALVSVCNETTHVAIGTGMVDTDNKIYLPAINTGANVTVTISASYFAA